MSDESDPWSKDVPIAPAPTEFVFGQPEPNAAPRLGAPGPGPASGRSPEDSTGADSASRRRWIAVGAGLSVAVVGLLAATVIRDGGGPKAATDSSIAPASTTRDVLPDTTAPPTTEPTFPVSEGTTTGTGAPTQEAAVLPGVWVDGQLALPDRLSAIELPTQLVAVSRRGVFMEIDLQSGATSMLDLDQQQAGAQLYLRDRATLITNDGGSGPRPPIIVERGVATIEVDLPDRTGGFYMYDDGSNVGDFYGETYSNSTGDSTQVAIGLDGSLTPIEDSFENIYFGQYAVSTGELVRYDAGDVFLVSPEGQQPATSRRITTGTLIGRSPTALFANECDETRTCGYFLIDVVSGERTAVPTAEWDQFSRNLQVASMSPDGTAMLVASGQAGEAFFVELMTGDTMQLPMPIGANYSSPAFAWAPDSSGIFTVDSGEIVFFDRVGEATPLPIGFTDTGSGDDTIVGIGARPSPTS